MNYIFTCVPNARVGWVSAFCGRRFRHVGGAKDVESVEKTLTVYLFHVDGRRASRPSAGCRSGANTRGGGREWRPSDFFFQNPRSSPSKCVRSMGSSVLPSITSRRVLFVTLRPKNRVRKTILRIAFRTVLIFDDLRPLWFRTFDRPSWRRSGFTANFERFEIAIGHSYGLRSQHTQNLLVSKCFRAHEKN